MTFKCKSWEFYVHSWHHAMRPGIMETNTLYSSLLFAQWFYRTRSFENGIVIEVLFHSFTGIFSRQTFPSAPRSRHEIGVRECRNLVDKELVFRLKQMIMLRQSSSANIDCNSAFLHRERSILWDYFGRSNQVCVFVWKPLQRCETLLLNQFSRPIKNP